MSSNLQYLWANMADFRFKDFAWLLAYVLKSAIGYMPLAYILKSAIGISHGSSLTPLNLQSAIWHSLTSLNLQLAICQPAGNSAC